MITVQGLASELGITVERLGEIAGLKSWAPTDRLPDEVADRARAEFHMAEGKPAPEVTEATELTLETYKPGPIVEAAFDAAVHACGDNPMKFVANPTALAPIMFILAAVVLAEVVEIGIKPYATSPGVLGDPDEAAGASKALTEWAWEHMISHAMAELANRAGKAGARLMVFDLRNL